MRLDDIIVQQSNQSRLSPLEISMTTKSLLAFNIIFGLFLVYWRWWRGLLLLMMLIVFIVGMKFSNVIGIR
jgi:hypothetical protein